MKTKTKKMPEFICSTPYIEYVPIIDHEPYQALIALYLLRMTLGLRHKIDELAVNDLFREPLTKITGLISDEIDFSSCVTNKSKKKSKSARRKDAPHQVNENFDIDSPFKKIENRLRKVLAKGISLNVPLFSNINWLAEELCLSDCDKEILVIGLLISNNSQFSSHFSNIKSWQPHISVIEYLHAMTTRPINELELSLHPNSLLCRIGFLDKSRDLDITRLLMLPLLFNSLFEKFTSSENLYKVFFKSVKPTALKVDAYPLLQKDLEVLIPYLKMALKSKQVGVNVLIYGDSKPGKWELTRILAKSINAQLFKVSEVSQNGCELEAEDRFASCQLTKAWLSQHEPSGLLVMDEADKVLPQKESTSYLDGEEIKDGIDLIVMKRQMSANTIPIIWIINNPKRIDTDCLRLFNYALAVDKLPEALRQKLINRATRKLTISSVWKQHLTMNSGISLTQIKNAAAVAKLSQSKISDNADNIMAQVLNSHSRLFNRGVVIKHHRPTTNYDPRLSNTSISLEDLLKGVQRNMQGNFCFYGASGAGKSAFAQHLAEQLGLPILSKRASDVLGKYAGDNEKGMADMFREAQNESAILLLDEADSLLFDRRDAHNNWEVSMVNEMLTQLEQFQGIFICTTNLMEKMDVASLRRFDFKVKFDYLTTEQRWTLFVQESQRLGIQLSDIQAEEDSLKQQIHRLTKLTPGDFAVLNRQSRFSNETLALSSICTILQQECLAKGENFAKIGFVQ